MPTDDAELIRECLSGRTDAYGQLVVRYQDRLFNTLAKMLGSSEDAQDVAQEAFVHAFQKLDTFRGNSAFYSWLFRIAVNAAVSRKRKAKRSAVSIESARESRGAEPADPHPEIVPSHPLELSEQQAQVRDALARLPEDFRTVLVLKEIDGFSYEEIAQVVGIPVGTVRSRIHRARNEMRQRLAALLEES